jgi:tetratricopeptide (TPR) repeat protein
MFIASLSPHRQTPASGQSSLVNRDFPFGFQFIVSRDIFLRFSFRAAALQAHCAPERRVFWAATANQHSDFINHQCPIPVDTPPAESYRVSPVPQAPAISRSPFGRTLGVAGLILGAAALAEIVIAGVALVDRARHNEPLGFQAPPPVLPGGPQTAEASHSQPAFNDPFASAGSTSFAAPGAQATPLQFSPLAKPTPVSEALVTTPQTRMDAEVTEAIALRDRGDTSTAITRLQEALAMSPKNPMVISELATTYEKMGLDDKALEQWRAIFDLGPNAGIYYTAAQAKLQAAQLTDSLVSSTPANSTSGPYDDSGFPPGSSLALMNLSTVEKPETPEGYRRLELKIPIRRRANMRIDVPNVKIQVFFYDQLGDNSFVHTNANVSAHWNNLPADWQAEDIEILDVDYTQAAPEPGEVAGGRHYYGYIVCVYYNKALQDQAADPPTLLKANPPPPVLPDSEK